jgi:hypothetical protein
MKTTADLEQQVATLQEQVKMLARALNEAMRTPVLREYFSVTGDRNEPWYREHPTYNAVSDIAWPSEDCVIYEEDD